jgi:hypothetical protein
MFSKSSLCVLSLATVAAAGWPSSVVAQEKPAPHPQLCAAVDYHRMDYMIGDWDVVATQTGKHFLFNTIEAIDGGCAVRESLIMQKDVPGTSITFFSAQDQRWYSYYHSPSLHAVLEGTTSADGVSDLMTTMVLPGGKEPQQVRQVTDRDSAGRPHQAGYARTKSGEWQQIWDLTFCARRAAAKPAPPCGGAGEGD